MKVIWEPHPGSQTLFLTCPFDEVLYHGTRGPGKSDSLIMDFAQEVGAGYGEAWRGILFRQTYKQLADIIAKTKKWYPRIFPGVKFNESDHKWVWPTGEELLLRYMQRPNDYWEYHGHEYPWIGWEELTNWPTIECYDLMRACNRSSTPGIPKRTRANCNPWGAGHCVPYGEVLTPDGWVDIKDMRIGDPVYTVLENGELSATKVDQIHRQYYRGDLVTINQRGLHICCTPEHKIAKVGGTHTNRGGLFSLVQMKDLPGQAYIKRDVFWKGTAIESFSPAYTGGRKRKLNQPKSITGDQYMRLLGWFLSEGCTSTRDKEFYIAQKKQPQRDEIESLLNDCGFSYRSPPDDFCISCPDWFNYFQQFGKCREKFIPKEAKNATQEQLALLLDALIKGDGCSNDYNDSVVYYTLSKQLSDDVSEIALKLGFVTYTSMNRECYVVNIKRCEGGTEIITGNHIYNVDTQINGQDDRKMKYDNFEGEVYCIGIKNTHSFIMRQKGATWISGNSWVKKYFIDAGVCGEAVIESMKHPVTGEMMSRVRTHLFGSIFENTHLLQANPEYLMTLIAIKDENMKKAWLEGSWDIVAGGFFGDVWNPSKHLIKSWVPPKHWEVFTSFDWGSASPFSVGFWTISDGGEAPDGKFYPRGAMLRFDEIYGCKKGEDNVGLRLQNDEIGRRIITRMAEWNKKGVRRFDIGVADPSIYSDQGGPSIYDQIVAGTRKVGYHRLWDKADNSRLPGWAQMRGRLEGEDDGPPLMYIMERCRDFVRTVPGIPRDERNWDDVDTEVEDHICDETRYAAMRKKRVFKEQKLGGL